jgi:hypothetical protein
MNMTSHRRLLVEQDLRERIKDRVAEANERNATDSVNTLGAPTPGDECTCPMCRVRRAASAGAGTQVFKGVVKVEDGESLMDALGRAAKTLIDAAEADDAAKAGKKAR